MTNEEIEINNLISKVFNEHVEGRLDDALESKTFITSMCLLKCFYDNDENAMNLFAKQFRKLSFEEKIQVLNNVSANIKEQKKSKQKVKGKNG